MKPALSPGTCERHPALAALHDQLLLRECAYIDGRWFGGDAVFDVRDPATAVIVARVANLGAAEATLAVDAAARAFPVWKALLPQQRADRLRAWYEAIRGARDDLALIMTLEQGKRLAESLGEIDYAASFVEWYAEEAKRLNVEGVTPHL
ncbi:MAG TPA: aldehyde dehydrogenase family protein, partial [Casimicrobiaceae bacterium]